MSILAVRVEKKISYRTVHRQADQNLYYHFMGPDGDFTFSFTWRQYRCNNLHPSVEMLTYQARSTVFNRISHMRQRISAYQLDFYLGSALATVFGIVVYVRSQAIDPVVFGDSAWDVWFGADLPRVFSNLVDRKSDHSRLSLHPLFSLIAGPPTLVLVAFLHLPAIVAVRIVCATVASIWLSALFTLLRVIGCRRFDATLLSVLATTSAAAVFWFAVPETYPLGSLSLIVALIFAAIVQQQAAAPLTYSLVSLVTLSFTVTNWMAGIVIAIVHHHWKQALQITANALSLMVVLWSIQKLIYRSAGFFDWGDADDKKYILSEKSGGFVNIIQSFFGHTIVMPALQIVEKSSQPDYPLMLTQFSSLGSSGFWGIVATGLWLALLGVGVWAFLTMKQSIKLRWVLGLCLLGQLTLHLIYGRETFLYALHFLPLLILLVALSTLTRMRLIALSLTGLLILTATLNNGAQFDRAIAYFAEHGPQSKPVPRVEVAHTLK